MEIVGVEAIIIAILKLILSSMKKGFLTVTAKRKLSIIIRELLTEKPDLKKARRELAELRAASITSPELVTAEEMLGKHEILLLSHGQSGAVLETHYKRNPSPRRAYKKAAPRKASKRKAPKKKAAKKK